MAHKASARVVDRMEGDEAETRKAMDAYAKRAAFNDILDEFAASMEGIWAACAEMTSPDYVHPYIDIPRLQFALSSLLETRSTPFGVPLFELVYTGRAHLAVIVAELDRRELDSAPIGSRPPGPGFYQRQQARAEAAAEEQRRVTARPGGNPANGDSVPGTVSPYDDLREPWYRRLLGRNRGRR